MRILSAIIAACLLGMAGAESLPVVKNAAPQPAVSQAKRLVEALAYLGAALKPEDAERIAALAQEELTELTSLTLQSILDPYCIAGVNINPEARVKVKRGPAEAVLQENGWVTYLVKVANESGTRAELKCDSPNSEPVLHASTGSPEPNPKNAISAGELENRFLEINMYGAPPMERALSGATLEYRVIQFYTPRSGQYEATLSFHVGQGTQDIGYRNALHVLFPIKPSVKLIFDVKDDDGSPAMASFIIRDNIDRFTNRDDENTLPADYRLAKAQSAPWQRPGLPAKALTGVYPLPSRRVADTDEYPDFFFQPQIYRADGESVALPPGTYDVTFTRGPEYLPQTRTITVTGEEKTHKESFQLKRWVNLEKRGWYSLDHHVHAGGCSHYESPTAGVKPEAMLRQADGEGLSVSCVLTWGPCWYYQKNFFEGKVAAISERENILRYDVEVSGFPSSHAGHVVLLRLAEDDYPGTTKIEEWPTWTLPVLKWGQGQGGVVGYAHSGWGLETEQPAKEFPNFLMPRFNGIGANEFIVTATLGACDFISAGDTPLPQELNIWYHTLNCGLKTTISGETDFPCIFDERVGMARSYARVKKLDFDTFVQEIKEGANYVSDGRAHLLDFKVNDAAMGEAGSELKLAEPGMTTITAEALAYLPETQDEAGARIAAGGLYGRPYWNVEKARVGTSRKVAVDLVVNGYAIQRVEIEADGTPKPLRFEQKLDRSSWVALRVLGACHTNPIYVTVAGQPLRASKLSAQWCRDAVDQCWKNKAPAIKESEKAAAASAYDHARRSYEAILAESFDDATLGWAPTGIH